MAEELEDAPWVTGNTGGGEELPDAPWVQKPISWSDVPGQALMNAPHSAVEFGKNIVQPFIHPIDTAKGVASLAGGTAEKLAPYAPALGPFSGVMSGMSAASKYFGGNEHAADAVGKFIKERYGGVDELKHTLATDPVGFAGDLSAVLTGGGSLAARAPGIVGKVGEVANTAGRVVDPLRPITKTAEVIGNKLEVPKVWRKFMGVRLSEGQKEDDLLKIQREQAALRGQSGRPAQEYAQKFFDKQKSEVDATREGLVQELDPVHGTIDPYAPPPKPTKSGKPGKPATLKGAILADTSNEAGAMISSSMQNTYNMRRKVVSDYYNDAERFGGEVHPDFFDDIGDRIKGSLSSGAKPIIVDDKLTPFANAALGDLNKTIEGMKMGSGASGVPPRAAIRGVSLAGVNVARQRLAAFRDSAFASGNRADGRATQAVLRAFEDEVSTAVRDPTMFRGDPRAVTAWDNARAAHADVRSTFGAGRDDPAGRNIEKILGVRGSAPATAEQVMDMILPPGMNANATHVETVSRLKGALGEGSTEFAAVRQGVVRKLTETPPGVTDWGPKKVADRIHDFLNGKGESLAKEIFTPEQRARLEQFGELHRKLQVPQAGANWSNTATFMQRTVDRAIPWIMSGIGFGIGHAAAPGAPLLAEFLGAGIGRTVGAKVAQSVAERRNLREVKPQLPLVERKSYKGRPVAKYIQRVARPVVAQGLQNLPLGTLRAGQAFGRYTSPAANPYQP